MKSRHSVESVTLLDYSAAALPHLRSAIEKNAATLERIAKQLTADVKAGKSLLVFGSGHSALFPLELYHRAGGASFVLPLVADYLLPSAGPSVVRVLERTEGAALPILERANPKPGEMLWIASQSGINAAVVDFALAARAKKLRTIAFSSVAHSQAVPSRHPSGKRLFEVCDEVVDLGGFVGDAAVKVSESVSAGPLSTLTLVLLGHSVLSTVCARLEKTGTRCIYTSVNTPTGAERNLKLEKRARRRDYRL